MCSLKVGSFKEQSIYKIQNPSVTLEHLSTLVYGILDIIGWMPVAVSCKDLMFFAIHKQPCLWAVSLALFDKCFSPVKQGR